MLSFHQLPSSVVENHVLSCFRPRPNPRKALGRLLERLAPLKAKDAVTQEKVQTDEANATKSIDLSYHDLS